MLDIKRLQDLDSGTSWFKVRSCPLPDQPAQLYFGSIIRRACTLRRTHVFHNVFLSAAAPLCCAIFCTAGRNAAINLTYLKNCVVGCLRTSEPSEHARLLPVITTILKLSEDEAAVIARNISTRAQHQGSFGGGDLVGGGVNTTSRSWWSTSLQKK